MIVYGKNVFAQLQENPESIEEVYLQDGMKDKKIAAYVKSLENIPVKTVSKSWLDKKTDNQVHQGIAAKTKEIKTCSLQELISKIKKNGKPGFIVALDGIQDPHNLGAILRTADCAGADGIIIPKHNAAGLTPTAVKSSTGAAYTVPTAAVANMSQALQELKKEGYWVAGTDMANARDYREGMYDSPTVIVIGNEGKGISPLVKKQCDYMVTLPMKGSISSLNASVAAALLMYEVMRQRDLNKADA